MKITYDFISAKDAKKFFGKDYPVYIATAAFKEDGCLTEIHGAQCKTKALALNNLKRELKSCGVNNMFKILGTKNIAKTAKIK